MAFQRYGGKYNMIKNVFEIDEAYDIKKSFRRARKVTNNSPNEDLVDERVQRLFSFDDSSSSDPDTT